MRNRVLPLFESPERAPAPADLDAPVAKALNRLAKRRQPDYEREFAFQCRTMKLPEPHEQYLFAKELNRRFTADFAWTKYRLIVEIQGGIWRPGGGAHSHPIDLERDIERAQYMAILRWTYLPVTPKQVMSGYGIELTQRVLEKLGWVLGSAVTA